MSQKGCSLIRSVEEFCKFNSKQKRRKTRTSCTTRRIFASTPMTSMTPICLYYIYYKYTYFWTICGSQVHSSVWIVWSLTKPPKNECLRFYIVHTFIDCSYASRITNWLPSVLSLRFIKISYITDWKPLGTFASHSSCLHFILFVIAITEQQQKRTQVRALLLFAIDIFMWHLL